ncbi:helix-turn-helix domain-containing protein [Mycolicibacterium sp. 120266]|uniref:sigma-54-dependent Fis family transcriptional regulator n=1 Tax=Mycolicibacterium sp. 120266 TaxID=3090601 RepID=UPI00299EE117|nr:helix-turn-helix domain-containing protein [Mycolicibacterium sp. 120266]MDX1875721.1 helix-turn-helix domain-containing protein [Mycolicibacterium sp. 120266]
MSERLGEPRFEEIRAQFLSSADQAVPAEVLASWLRSTDALGAPGNVRDVPRVDEDLLDNHLLEMFQAPMARAAEDLAGSGMGLLLADAQGRIVQRWSQDSVAMNQLDRLGTVRGAVLAEDVVGTNGVGTALAAGKSVLIQGAEHFADVYQNALCTGAPVWHPITGKLLAAVTMSTRIDERSGLLLPLTNSLAAQLQQHVLDVAQPGARAMLAAFLDASKRHDGPVVAFGPDGLTMRSRRAGELTQSDVDLIGHLCSGLRHDTRMTAELSVGSTAVDVRVLDGAAGMVAALRPAPRTSASHPGPAADALVGQTKSWLHAAHQVSRHIAAGAPLLIAGESGTGKTSLALGRPHRLGAISGDVAVVHTAQRQIIGEQAWLQELAGLLATAPRIIIRAVEHLDARALDALRALIGDSTASVLLTATADSQAAAEARAGRLGVAMVWVPPLRERTADLGALWNAFVAHRSPGLRLTLSEEARRALEAAGWPGNLVELRTVVAQLVSDGVRGVVRLDRLPDALRARRSWSMIERTEMETIRRALQESGGNRSKAAELLGVSRATIHRKLKTYHLDG